jgi:hypothetical protein
VSDVSDTNPVDTSASYFSITMANISTQPASLSFGNVVTGQTRSDTVRIYNSGSGPLVVTSVTTGTSRFTPGRTSFTIPPGSSDTLSVVFIPVAVQSYLDTLRINSNAVEGQAVIPLSGTGTLAASVTVLSPNGGEVWMVGTVHSVTWSQTLLSEVNLAYRILPTSNWRTIAQNVPAAPGSYLWTIPNSPANEVVVRIASSSDGSVIDESDSPFTIDAPTSVTELGGIPQIYELGQNYPNPFNPVTRIAYGVPRDGRVVLSIYNSLGQEIVRLVDQHQQAGRYAVEFASSDKRVGSIASGLYYYTMRSGDFVETRKMLLIK